MDGEASVDEVIVILRLVLVQRAALTWDIVRYGSAGRQLHTTLTVLCDALLGLL